MTIKTRKHIKDEYLSTKKKKSRREAILGFMKGELPKMKVGEYKMSAKRSSDNGPNGESGKKYIVKFTKRF